MIDRHGAGCAARRSTCPRFARSSGRYGVVGPNRLRGALQNDTEMQGTIVSSRETSSESRLPNTVCGVPTQQALVPSGSSRSTAGYVRTDAHEAPHEQVALYSNDQLER